MAFPQTEAKTPSGIGKIVITLVDQNGQDVSRSISASAKILDQNGEPFSEWSGDLLPHLTQPQISALIGFLNAMRAKAVDELLP